jgi:hypothetical protein
MIDQHKNNTEDIQQRLNRIGHSDAIFIKELVSIFLRNLTHSMLTLNQKKQPINLTEKQQAAHKLKSNFVLLEYGEASILASKIEHAKTAEEMAKHIEELNAITPHIIAELSVIE